MKHIVFRYLCLALLFFFTAPHPVSKGCGPIDYSFKGYSFISPFIAGQPIDSSPLLPEFATMAQYFEGVDNVQEKDNITEWWERFCEYPEKEDMAYIIYKASVYELIRLRDNLYDKEAILDYRLVDNTFAHYLKNHKCTETLDYLIFAKKCEEHCLPLPLWENKERNVEVMHRLANEGLEAFRRTKSYYIKLRYAYQIVRLAHYAKDYELAIELYDFCRPKTDNKPSIIDYWLMGHKAGALMALGDNVEASYLYSLIFENCPSKHESAYRSFRINTDAEWQACLNKCKDDRERATLYAVRAGAKDSRALEEMTAIYELDPTNRHLEALLIREMKKLEKNLLGLGFNDHRAQNRRYHGIPKEWAGQYVIDMQAFARKLLEEGLVQNPSLWKIAEGYLEVLAGDYYQASRTFAEAKTITQKRELKQQLEVFELALQISSFQATTDSVENKAAQIIRTNDWFRIYPDFPDFLYDKMGVLYENSNNPGKAFLCRYSIKDLKPNPDRDILDDLIQICQKPNRNRMEIELVGVEAENTILRDLLDIRAARYLSQYQLEAAVETYKEMDREYWDDYGLFNPFVDRLNDCVHCPLPDSVQVFNRGEIVERLIDLEYRAKTEPENSAQLYYQVGLAFYNMSYFSYAWKVNDYYRSGASLLRYRLQDGGSLDVVNTPFYPLGNREVFDCSQALYFFNRARLDTKDPELAAKATFMAAKCERNDYYVNRFNPGVERTYRYFDVLRDKYSQTQYYDRVVRECKTFSAYLRR